MTHTDFPIVTSDFIHLHPNFDLVYFSDGFLYFTDHAGSTVRVPLEALGEFDDDLK